MMAHKLVAQCLKAFGLPFTLQAFPIGGAPKPPFICYKATSYGEVFTDDALYINAPKYAVELYEREADMALEDKLYDHLTAQFGGVERTEAWMESESARVVVYTFQVLNQLLRS